MFTAGSVAVVTSTALARILLFICLKQIVVTNCFADFDGPFVDKYFPSGRQCDNGGHYYNISLSECHDLCLQLHYGTVRCTAFNYHEGDNDCALRICPLPVAPPPWDKPGWNAYSLKPVLDWKTLTNGTAWTNAQCPELGVTEPVVSLYECQSKCRENKACTAINYRVVSGCNLCELVNCPYPIPVPGEVVPGNIPYYIIKQDCEFQDNFKDACAVLECNIRTGKYLFKGYDKKCPMCKTYLDPHIVTYDQMYSSYSYQGCGNYSLSQDGNTYHPAMAVYANFETCGAKYHSHLTCVDTVTFKNDEHTIITLRYDVDENSIEIQVNGENIDTEPSVSLNIVQAMGTAYPVLAWRSSSCVNLQGSSGILVKFCGSSRANQVYVYASPNVTGDLEGLCGTVTGNINDDFVSRDGVIYSPWQKYPPLEFPLSWLTNSASNGSCDDGQSNLKRQSQPQNRCETNATVEEAFLTQCKESVTSGLPNAEAGLVEALVDDCVYDLCNVTDPVQWMQAIEENIQVENETMSRTIDPSTGPPTEGYKYYPGKYWNISVCPYLSTIYNVSLKFCFSECTSNASCTAFYFAYYRNSNMVDCRLISCPTPVPEPTRNSTNGRTSGYAIITGPAPGPPTEDQFLGPMKKIWTDTACTHLENHWYISLSECKTLCLNTTTCSAINYEEDRLCVLRGCSPVPKPTWNYPTFQGYAIATAMYIGPFANIWSDCQCPPIRNYHDKTLSECETLCANDEDCTAINFSDADCVLRACPNPVPPPNLFYPPFQGYAIEADTKQCVQSRKCSRNKGSCISKINWDSCDGRLNKRWCNGNQCACCVPLIE